MNVSYDFDDGFLEEKGYLTHMIGFATTKENTFDDLEQLSIEVSRFKKLPLKFILNGCPLQVKFGCQ